MWSRTSVLVSFRSGKKFSLQALLSSLTVPINRLLGNKNLYASSSSITSNGACGNNRVIIKLKKKRKIYFLGAIKLS